MLTKFERLPRATNLRSQTRNIRGFFERLNIGVGFSSNSRPITLRTRGRSNEETIWDLGFEALIRHGTEAASSRGTSWAPRCIGTSGRYEAPVGVEKPPLTCSDGAEDGIRTRDPHLGKVMRYHCATSALSEHSIAVTAPGAERVLSAPSWSFATRDPRVPRRITPSVDCPSCTRTSPAKSSAGRSVPLPASTTVSGRVRRWRHSTGSFPRVPPTCSRSARARASSPASSPGGSPMSRRSSRTNGCEPSCPGRTPAWRSWRAAPRSSPPPPRRTTSSLPPRRGTGSTSSMPSPRWRGCCAPAAASPSCGAGRTGPSTGCGRSGPVASSSAPKTGPTWTRAEGSGTRSTSHAGGPSPFLEPETALFRWSRPMTKEDLVALATTYSAVITMDDDARRQHLGAMARLPRRPPALCACGRPRRPHALLLLAGNPALTCDKGAPRTPLRGCDKGP